LREKAAYMPSETIDNEEIIRHLQEHVQEELARRTVQLGGDHTPDQAEQKTMIAEIIEEYTQYFEISDEEKARFTEDTLNDLIGFGPLEKYLSDPTITDIMVMGCEKTFIERHGVEEPVPEKLFETDEQVRDLIEKIGRPLDKHCNAQTPMMDARLPDGSRVNAIIYPLSRFGSILTIRKFSRERLGPTDLMNVGSCNANMLNFLKATVVGRCNILVSGGTGSGKTTFLNILSSFIPENQYVITIEDAAELQLQHNHWGSLESRTANTDGTGAITIHDLLKNTLRMNPARIIIGECRGDEAFEMLQAMNTGHTGSLTTIHADTALSAFNRIESMVAESSPLPALAIRRQAADAIQIVVQLLKYPDGSRKVSEIRAITKMEGETIGSEPLFKYQFDHMDAEGHVIGRHIACNANLPDLIMNKIVVSGAKYKNEWLHED
jgi:pilus assembly protein CpaF